MRHNMLPVARQFSRPDGRTSFRTDKSQVPILEKVVSVGLIDSIRKSSNTFHAAMRVPVVEYITLALSSGLTSYGVPGP
jgi:hypothetical protein